MFYVQVNYWRGVMEPRGGLDEITQPAPRYVKMNKILFPLGERTYVTLVRIFFFFCINVNNPKIN